MFHVEKQEFVNKTFRFPVELAREMERLAQEKNISFNQLAIQCCRYALDNLDDDRNK